MIKKKIKKSAKKPAVKKKTKKKVKKAAKPKGPKVLGKITHIFDKISVAIIKVAAPLKVGDYIQIKGTTTDFKQKIDSIQINHKNVPMVGKGAEIGLKVSSHVRENDIVYAAEEETHLTVAPQPSYPMIQPIRPITSAPRPATMPPAKPVVPPTPKPGAQPKPGYDNTKFFKF